MNKSMFNYCKKHLRFTSNTKLKATATLEKLVEKHSIGTITDGYFVFDELDKQLLIETVARLYDGLLLSDEFPEKKRRDQNALHHSDEKANALKVSEGFVLVNSLHSLRLNKTVTTNNPLSSLGQFIYASEINTVEHKQIILVENLIVMANLSRLNIPESLKDALWLYRGDQQAHKQTGCAYQLFRRFKESHQLVCFSDLDPSGLQIAMTCGAQSMLTLSNLADLSVENAGSGEEQEWFNQTHAKAYLNKQKTLPKQSQLLFNNMKQKQLTLQQEHMLAHDLPLVCYQLI